MNVLSVLVQGGWLMIPILLSSLIAIYIIIERFIVIRKSKMNVPVFLVKIRGLLKRKDITGAIAYCMEEKSPSANIVKKRLTKL